MTEVVVIGAGGFGRETLDVIEAHNAAHLGERIVVTGVVDDAPDDMNLRRLHARGYQYVGTIAETLQTSAVRQYVMGVGSPAAKRVIAARFDAADWQAIGVIHPAAVVGSVAEIGTGSIVCGGVQLSTNARLGRHVHLNPNVTVGHDSVLGDFVSVNPGAIVSGEVIVREGVLIGAGAVVLQGLQVGARAVVGAAACATHDVRKEATVKGVPAR